jgi:CubicO group peptidase (beta-lactamase class C family)
MKNTASYIGLGSLILVIGCCLPICHPASAGSHGSQGMASPPAKWKAIVSGLETTIPRLMDEGDVPGLSVGLIGDNKVIWSHGFGVRSTETREPVTDSTIFEAASLSKAVIAYAVLKLSDEGKIGLDVPLSKYLPNYIEGDDRINLITARTVMSHRTGFPNWRRGSLKIYFTPGERFSYSGEGFVYLAKVVERITGQPLNDFMKHEVFEPLGMTSSNYVWRDDYDLRTAVGHDDARAPHIKVKPINPNAAASLHTTALDYSKFVIAVMTGAGLKPQTAAQMLTPQVKVNPACTDCIEAMPGALSDSLGWGLGIGLEHTDQGDSFWHWGDNGLFKCYVQAYPKQQAGIVVFTNSEYGLSIIPDIVNVPFPGPHPAFAWLKYGRYDSPDHRFLKAILGSGADEAIKKYADSAAKGSRKEIDERDMNNVGYVLLRLKWIKDAISVFQLNVADHPDSWNAYDSLAEAYVSEGDKDLAVKNYKKSIELNPANKSGGEMLKKLQEGR